MGSDYRAVFEGLSDRFPECNVIFSRGRIGAQLHDLKRWLLSKSNRSSPSTGGNGPN